MTPERDNLGSIHCRVSDWIEYELAVRNERARQKGLRSAHGEGRGSVRISASQRPTAQRHRLTSRHHLHSRVQDPTCSQGPLGLM